MRNCPVCSKVLRNQLLDRVNQFYEGCQVYFNTVTMQADDTSNIMKHWHLLTIRIRYYYPYILIFWTKEPTKRGVYHIHFLSSQAIDGAWLSRVWFEITGTSYIVKAGNTTGEIRNPAAYMMKYMTKAHSELELFNKGERIYGFLGARAPPRQNLPRYSEEPAEFMLDQHWNTASAYWMHWYNEKQLQYGRPFIEYMERATITVIQATKLNFESPNIDTMFTGVKLYDNTGKGHPTDEPAGTVERNRERLKKWRQLLENPEHPGSLLNDRGPEKESYRPNTHVHAALPDARGRGRPAGI